jgi:hypothetical protein
MTEEDIMSLSECDGMLDILENAVANMQMMPESLHDAIVKAAELRKARRGSVGDV